MRKLNILVSMWAVVRLRLMVLLRQSHLKMSNQPNKQCLKIRLHKCQIIDPKQANTMFNSSTQRQIPLLAQEKNRYHQPLHTLLSLNRTTLPFILIHSKRVEVLEVDTTAHTQSITHPFKVENSCKIQ